MEFVRLTLLLAVTMTSSSSDFIAANQHSLAKQDLGTSDEGKCSHGSARVPTYVHACHDRVTTENYWYGLT